MLQVHKSLIELDPFINDLGKIDSVTTYCNLVRFYQDQIKTDLGGNSFLSSMNM